MSWSIYEMVNTVDNIPNECIHDLFDEAQDYEGQIWADPKEVVDERGLLRFDPELMEHMDYLANDKAIRVLKRYEVEGDICFGSLEGDDAGEFWGYRFDGKGGMKKLKGRIVWEEKADLLKNKTVVITGTLKSMTREEAKDKVTEAGGTSSDAVSKNTDYLVIGNKPGSKLKKARQLGVKIIDENEFRKFIE